MVVLEKSAVLVLISFFLLGCTAVAEQKAVSDEGGLRLHSREGNFSVVMPVSPTESKQANFFGIADVEFTVFSAREGSYSYQAAYADLPGETKANADSDKFLSGASNRIRKRETSSTAPEGKLDLTLGSFKGERKIYLEGGIPGALLEYGLDYGIRSYAIFLAGGRVYAFVWTKAHGSPSTNSSDKFFDSIAIGGKRVLST